MTQFNSLSLLVSMLEEHTELTADDRGAILSLPYTIEHVEPQTYLIREGEAPTTCAVVLSGFAYRHKLTRDGSRSIAALHIPGDLLDLQHLQLEKANHSVQMLSRGTVAMIPKATLQNLIRGRDRVTQAIISTILVEASILREWLLNVGRREGLARLAHLLCELAVRLEARHLTEQMGYELPMTQDQLADALGLTSVHINRLIKRLETEGYIVRKGRHVTFPNWQRIRNLGQFEPSYLHLVNQGL